MTFPDLSLRRLLQRMFSFVPARRRGQGLAVLGLMVLGAVAELLTLGAVLPFLALISDPQAPSRYPLLGSLLHLLGLNNRADAVAGLALLFCLIAVGAAATRILLAWASQKYVFRLGYDIGTALYRRILYQPYSFHAAHNSTQVLSGINKVQQVLLQTMIPAMQGVSAAIIAIFILGGLLLVNAPVALSAAATFGLIYAGVSYTMRRRLRGNGAIIARMGAERIKTVQEGLGGIRDVLIDQAQPVYLRKFTTIDSQYRDAQAANALIGATPRFVIEGLGMAMIVMLALVLSRQPGGLATALPVLGALAVGAQRLLPLLQQIYNGWTQITGSRAAMLDVLELLERPLPSDIALRRNVRPIPFERSLALEGVSFRYSPDGTPVLRDIDLLIPKGARVGFIGKTGSGKSTLLDIVMGLLRPDAGAVTVDGRPLDERSVVGWQVQIAHVPQAIYLSDATIIENIAFGVPREEIEEARARDAATRADIDAFIAEQPDGYDAIVGERGVRLSGGQRQRIGIARALYKQSTLLVLDEATSALDDETEAAVMRSIERLGGEITVLMIAHRVTTLRNCDTIVRLERGRIVQQGSYKEIVGAAPTLPTFNAAKA